MTLAKAARARKRFCIDFWYAGVSTQGAGAFQLMRTNRSRCSPPVAMAYILSGSFSTSLHSSKASYMTGGAASQPKGVWSATDGSSGKNDTPVFSPRMTWA